MTRYYQVPVTFSEWRRFAFYSIEDCVLVFQVSRRTVCNWESGKIKPPRAVFICLQLFSGRLDFLGKDWKGFRINPECIESPDGDFVRAWEVRALRYAMQTLDIRRDRRCRMNESSTQNSDKKPYNVTCIDEAPKKLKPVPFVAGLASLKPAVNPLDPKTERDKKDCFAL